ncbi:putative glycosyltransferase [Bacillus sp. TS-2]|nr:putative glycosyltransferase [Bacillus sp. TS-2]
MSKVVVSIVTFNSEQDIVNCLDALANQSLSIHEIQVIDNFSKDHTVQLIEDWFVKNKNIPLKLVKNLSNVGFAKGHNQVIRDLTKRNRIYEYLLVLNPDVILDSDFIVNCTRVLEEHQNIGSATGKLYRDKKNKRLDSTGLTISKTRRAFDRGANEIDNGQWDQKQEIFGVSGAAAIYRYEMIQESMVYNEFFDETFFAYKEDVDIAWRAQNLGWDSLFIPNAIAVHLRGWDEERSRSTVPLFIRKHSYINRHYMMLKNEFLPMFFLNSITIVFFEFMMLLYLLLFETKTLTAWRDFLQNFKKMRKKRKYITNKASYEPKKVYKYFKGLK